ncbi:bifunctional RNase H/acid phosphatase [Allostreptomyces psammosilenae]|uniref:Putative phosphoglycerate mutase n=1 Tax=Allostreptomyces psammosilenae TaxID=1892865 RepID=A0A853A8E9_9ACTN|nr:bifunctional RNase H/acid phosphatase [Allostreptomyces psammosilenae]NYI06808.1 putative phosphoglycerate mutase [Allostreptomyces psammosilenae]
MSERVLVVEADGGSRGNPGPAGYGAVVRDAATGELLAETAQYIGRATNNVAEYRGLIAGLRAAAEIDPAARVEVLMDSKLVVEQMSGRWKIKHPDMRPLATEARAAFPAERVVYRWVPRAQNSHADRLANEAMDAGGAGRQWVATTIPAPQPAAAPATAPAGAAAPATAATAATAGAARAGAAPAGTPTATAPTMTAPTAPTGTMPGTPPAGWAADLGTATTLLLLRHGETPLTPLKRFSGTGGDDPELSERGLDQARRAAEALAAGGGIDAVVASPLARCRQTAQVVADRLGLPVRVEEGFREADFGAFEGLTFAEVQQRMPDALNAWLADTATPPPGGESLREVAGRVAVARDRTIARFAGRTVLVVSHVTPIKALVAQAIGAPLESLFRMELSAASLTAVQHYPDGNSSMRLFNDTAHLR